MIGVGAVSSGINMRIGCLQFVIDSNGIVRAQLQACIFGDLTAGELVTSADTIQVSIDMSTITEGQVEYTWQIEYRDPAGVTSIDEALVAEDAGSF